MTYTSHGHHIPGTVLNSVKPKNPKRCGGVELCARCKVETEEHMAFMAGEPTNYPDIAITILRRWLKPNLPPMTETFSVYVITFTKTLQNWKALLGTTLDDDMIYELTHSGDKHETYVVPYRQISNHVIPD